jgi:ubiquinone/menaquinone biosynthesis C-methylase UbiE
MKDMDVRFSGSVPANYERYLVPLLFRPYAEEMARRAAALQPVRVLETAAGTGVVTSALVNEIPDAGLVATDLNQAMLDVAATRVSSPYVSFRVADALELPFDDGSFDLVVCQFGAMFYPDKVKGGAEARRVLSDGGHYLLAIWDSIERNPMSDITQQVLAEEYPDDPPMFLMRGPFSYYEPQWIERDLKAAGFSDVKIETVEITSRAESAEEASRGLCYGSPMRVELEEYGPDAVDTIFIKVARASQRFEGPDGFEVPMSAHIVTATK